MDLTENMVNQPGKEILFAHFASNLLKSGELDKAIKVCERGLKKFPTYAQAHYILARCYIRKKLNDEARAELERVLRYDPNHKKAIRDLAGLYFANGFQDLYKEYLLQLLILDPLNENVIDEAKKLGEYKLWSSDNIETAPAESISDVVPESGMMDDKETVFVEADNEKTDEAETDPVFPDKIDLSQFDNVDDDFTTILHGKLEYSGRIPHPPPETNPDLSDVAKDIIEMPDAKDKAESTQEKDQALPSEDNLTTPENKLPPNTGKTQEDSINLESVLDTELSDVKSNSKPVEQTTGEDNKSSAAVNQGDVPPQKEDDLMDSDEFPNDEEEKFEQPKIISQTLGEILVSQQKYVEAKAVFEALKEKQPDNKALDLKIEYLDRIIGLEKKGKS